MLSAFSSFGKKAMSSSFFIWVLLFSLLQSASAATAVTDMNLQTPAGLANLLQGTGITINQANFLGELTQAGEFSGLDTAAGNFGSGAVLSSGNVNDLGDLNTSDSISTNHSGSPSGDADFDALVSGDAYDVAYLELEVVPDYDWIDLEFVFGSDEYNEAVNTSSNDAPGIFVNGENCALINDESVSVNHVHGGNPFGMNPAYEDFYINNDSNDFGASLSTEMDGFTVSLHCVAAVTPGQATTLKIGVADGGNADVDSWLLLKEGSLTSFPLDYGDAPDEDPSTGSGNYQTVEADGGPSHLMVGPYLGDCVDGEVGDLQSIGADADELDEGLEVRGSCAEPGYDEDGIILNTLEAGLDSTLYTYMGIGASEQNCVLDGWVDFNQDGDFEDSGEKIIDQLLLQAEGDLIESDPFPVPESAYGGYTAARFRCTDPSTYAFLEVGPDGFLPNGEVEDYWVQVIGDPAPEPFAGPFYDTDNDGTDDYLDTDDDNDGTSDADECNGDATCANPEDQDQDGIPDYLDAEDDGPGYGDSDSDGIPDNRECSLALGNGGSCTDRDRDLIFDYADEDSDDDGILDAVEAVTDTDNDGHFDQYDPDANATWDTDGDGLLDVEECGPIPTLCLDNDGDGLANFLDTDSDDDGTLDQDEGVDDPDADGIPDYVELIKVIPGPDDFSIEDDIFVTDDSDQDFILDTEECPNGYPCVNSDEDGIPDYADDDSDNDGTLDSLEFGVDSDGDGISDPFDSSDPLFSDDNDADGLLDTEECPGGMPCLDSDEDTLPDYVDRDSDNDSLPDFTECLGGSPCPDTDLDGVTDELDPIDPQGYFYNEEDGQILPGGTVSVTGPGVINLVKNGLSGEFQWFTDGTPGTYTMSIDYPEDYQASSTCLKLDPPAFDPPLGPDLYLGSSEDVLNPGFLESFACSDFYLTFELAAGDPFILRNNIPLGPEPPPVVPPVTPPSSGGGGGGGGGGSNLKKCSDGSYSSVCPKVEVTAPQLVDQTSDPQEKNFAGLSPIRECLEKDSNRPLVFSDLANHPSAPKANALKEMYFNANNQRQYLLSGYGSTATAEGRAQVYLNEPITRLALAKMLMVSECLPILDAETLPEKNIYGQAMPKYKDIGMNYSNAQEKWVRDLAYSASYYGFLNGTKEGYVEPARLVNRAEAVTLFIRAGELANAKEYAFSEKIDRLGLNSQVWYLPFYSKALASGLFPESWLQASRASGPVLRSEVVEMLLSWVETNQLLK